MSHQQYQKCRRCASPRHNEMSQHSVSITKPSNGIFCIWLTSTANVKRCQVRPLYQIYGKESRLGAYKWGYWTPKDRKFPDANRSTSVLLSWLPIAGQASIRSFVSPPRRSGLKHGRHNTLLSIVSQRAAKLHGNQDLYEVSPRSQLGATSQPTPTRQQKT